MYNHQQHDVSCNPVTSNSTATQIANRFESGYEEYVYRELNKKRMSYLKINAVKKYVGFGDRIKRHQSKEWHCE